MEKENNLMLISIVAIVAIVGMVVLASNNFHTGTNFSEKDLSGKAINILSGSSSDVKDDGTGGSCRSASDCNWPKETCCLKGHANSESYCCDNPFKDKYMDKTTE